MARTVIVFRDNMIEREKLAAIQDRSQPHAQVQRTDTISLTIDAIQTLGRKRAR